MIEPRLRRLVLASSSPRRVALLSRLGLSFEQRAADIDETPRPGEAPLCYVERMAQEKAASVAALEGVAASWVIGSDTIGEKDGEVLVKPRDDQDAVAILTKLSGSDHWVHTAVAFAGHGQVPDSFICSTRVFFRPLSKEEIWAYVRLGEGRDKAGAYGIQGRAAAFVTRIEGSYSSVVGLPLGEVANWLFQRGYRPWRGSGDE